MQNRVNILNGKSTGNEKIYKISLNGWYGYDGMNTERFMMIKFCDENQAHTSIISDRYRGGYKLNDSTWLFEKKSKYFKEIFKYLDFIHVNDALCYIHLMLIKIIHTTISTANALDLD